MASISGKTVTETGTTNPVKLSLKVRDTDRKVNYEESPAKGAKAKTMNQKLSFANRIVQGSVVTPIYTITSRN